MEGMGGKDACGSKIIKKAIWSNIRATANREDDSNNEVPKS